MWWAVGSIVVVCAYVVFISLRIVIYFDRRVNTLEGRVNKRIDDVQGIIREEN